MGGLASVLEMDEKEHIAMRQRQFVEHITISYHQDALLASIIDLYCPWGIEADVTYGRGCFYNCIIPKPSLRFDISPQVAGVIQADCQFLPMASAELRSIIYDPPFVVGPSASPGIMRDRFGCYKDIAELWQFYKTSLEETHRVLESGGIAIVKCQDTVSGGKNHFSHIAIYNDAIEIGFIAVDLFVLLAKHRISNYEMQQHARKYHSFFWVFKKP